MASTTALFTGLSGLTAHARNLDVIGNNIANVNTTAYKSSRLVFSNMFSRTVSAGSPPEATSGGTNPHQIGLGVAIAGTQRDFGTGAINATGDARDLAIEGKGLFVVDRSGQQFYTRAGSFRQNASQELVTIDGDRLQGYGVDADYNLVPGALGDITIPIGSLTLAEATGEVRFRGNLKADGDLPTVGSRVDIGGTSTAGLNLIAGATVPPAAGNILEGGSLLTEIEDPLLPGSGTRLLTAGQVLEINGAEKGTRNITVARFTVGAASTVQDFMTFLTDALGIETAAGANPDGSIPGLSLNAATGVLSITGNPGSVNDLDIKTEDLRLLDAAGAIVRQPFTTTKQVTADGESVRTTFIAYDSLGAPVTIDLAMVLDSKGPTGTSWRYYVESADDSDLATRIATGTLAFDTAGRLTTTGGETITIDRVGTGAATPLTMLLTFSNGAGSVTALSEESTIAAIYQDGSPFGTLSGYNVDPEGLITGTFSNGLTRTLGQVALATFTNQEGLFDEGGNLFRVGPASGPPQITAPGSLGAGRIVGGALELSNVDLSQEFIKMILTSTGYTASSRVIRTTDELIQQLLVLGR